MPRLINAADVSVVSALDQSGEEGRRRAPPTTRRRRRGRLFSLTARIGSGQYLAIAVGVFVALLAVWWGVTGAGWVGPLFLPSPVRVADRLAGLAMNGQLWQDTAVSVYRIALGFALATALAIPGGVLIGCYRVLDAAIEPLVDFVRYMPVVAFVPLTILWAGTSDVQKLLIIWIGTFFQQILMIQDNVKRVPWDFIDVGRTLEMPEWKILMKIVLPCAAPGIWDSLRISLGWAWTWLVLAELVAATSGLGYRITVAQRYFQTDVIIGYILVLGCFGLVTDQVMRALERQLFRYLEGRR